MKYNPKIREAMKEFKALLKKHDMGGTIILFTPSEQGDDFSEYHIGVETSWSCAFQEGEAIRVRSRLDKDYNGDKVKQQREARATAAMFTHFIDVSAFLRSNLARLKRTLSDKWDITHREKGSIHPITDENDD